MNRSGKSDKVSISQQKRRLLAAKIALFCTAFASLHLIIDFSQGMYQSALFDSVIVAAIFSCYLLGYFKFYQLSKIICLLFLNLSLVIYAGVVPKEVGVYLFYFPLMTISSALFGNDEKILRYSFIGIPFAALLFLFLTDFSFLEGYEFEAAPDTKMFFLINIISSGLMMVMCINFMLNLNEFSENELQHLAEEIKAKNEDLEKTNLELDRFLYSTSHDLRSPLSSIKGLINVARYDTSDAKMHGYFNMMTDRVDRLENFIKDIIDYSKNARTDLRHEVVDFDALIEEVTENLKYAEGASTIEFRNDIKLNHPVTLDKGRISVVLSNLLANAIKYHDFRKADRWIMVSISNSDNTIKMNVSDNGSGISEEHQQRIFEMFYRGTLQSTGSGLGLYIVKQTVEKMEGTIAVQSKTGEGSSFLVTLPIS